MASPVSVFARVSPRPKAFLSAAKHASACCLVAGAGPHARSGAAPRPRPVRLRVPRCGRPGPRRAYGRHRLPRGLRPRQEFPHQEHVRGVCGGELVGERHTFGRADEVQLHTVDRKGAPPQPGCPAEARLLGDLPGAQDREQRRVNDERRGVRGIPGMSGTGVLRVRVVPPLLPV
jgi:hypothetical protein